MRRRATRELEDRSSRPLRSPRRLTPRVELRIVSLRRREKLGPHRLAARLAIPRSTCYAVLRRHHLHRLAWMDRPTGVVIRRYERDQPGDLVHIDVKKLGRIPQGGGHRIHGRRGRHGTNQGYDLIHSAIDDHSRLAYSEVLANERGATCADFLRRAAGFFAAHGIRIRQVMTDNAMNYVLAHEFRAALVELDVEHITIQPYRPQTNGKVERFNRTLLEEWAYVRAYTSNGQRSRLLKVWLHRYNYHRSHTALAGLPPISANCGYRVNGSSARELEGSPARRAGPRRGFVAPSSIRCTTSRKDRSRTSSGTSENRPAPSRVAPTAPTEAILRTLRSIGAD